MRPIEALPLLLTTMLQARAQYRYHLLEVRLFFLLSMLGVDFLVFLVLAYLQRIVIYR